MLTIIFLGFIAMFAVAGIFISMEANKRGNRASRVPLESAVAAKRATGGDD